MTALLLDRERSFLTVSRQSLSLDDGWNPEVLAAEKLRLVRMDLEEAADLVQERIDALKRQQVHVDIALTAEEVDAIDAVIHTTWIHQFGITVDRDGLHLHGNPYGRCSFYTPIPALRELIEAVEGLVYNGELVFTGPSLEHYRKVIFTDNELTVMVPQAIIWGRARS